jgi:hypothetical protein
LCETYAQFLVAQRRSRQASLALAKCGESDGDPDRQALKAYDEFIDLYHHLALDASREMWLDARSLRSVLDDMVKYGQQEDVRECEQLVEIARKARQNLEDSFRVRLQYPPLHSHKDLGSYERRAQ